MTGYGLDDRKLGVRVSVGVRTSFLHVIRTDSGADLAVKLTTLLRLMPRSKKNMDLCICSPIHLQ
jgi:hypothetical protein